MKNIKIILMHGNGNSTPHDNWLPDTKHELERLGFTVIAPQFPDTPLCRKSYWLPYLTNELSADDHTILVGHSTGAIAALRFAETNRLFGSVLVGAYVTHLGIESEKKSEYFDEPWRWQDIKKNQQWIVQFASTDDPWIPIAEARELNQHLATEYYEYTDQGHFGGDYYKKNFPELIEILKKKLLVASNRGD